MLVFAVPSDPAGVPGARIRPPAEDAHFPEIIAVFTWH
jgi:hypothetical protein